VTVAKINGSLESDKPREAFCITSLQLKNLFIYSYTEDFMKGLQKKLDFEVEFHLWLLL